jgi:hypothetical protein
MPETRAQGYYSTYMQSKREKIQESLALAETELINNYNAEMAYREELREQYNQLTKDIMAYEKLLADIEEAQLRARKQTTKEKQVARKVDDLLKMEVDLRKAAATARSQDATRRVKVAADVAGLFEPDGQLQSTVQRLMPDIEAEMAAGNLESFGARLTRDPALNAALEGATEYQRRQAGTTLKTALRGLPGGAQLGEDTLNQFVGEAFGIEDPELNLDADMLNSERETLQSLAERKAYSGGPRGLLEMAEDIKTERESIEGAVAAGGPTAVERMITAPVEAEPRSPEMKALISALRNDGVVSPEEEKAYLRGVVEAGGSTKDLGATPLADLYEDNIDDLFLQRTQSIGALQAKRLGIETELAEPRPGAPTIEDIRSRAGEIYYPFRTRTAEDKLKGVPAQERREAREGAEETMGQRQRADEAYNSLTEQQKLLFQAGARAQQALKKNSGIIPTDDSDARRLSENVLSGATNAESMIQLAGESAENYYRNRGASPDQIRELRDEILTEVFLQKLHSHRAQAAEPTTGETDKD